MKNHKQHHFDHINHLKYSNLNFLLMSKNYKNLSILFVLHFLILLFYFIICKITKKKKKRQSKVNQFHIENQSTDMNNFHSISLNIVLHLNIDFQDNWSLFRVFLLLITFLFLKKIRNGFYHIHFLRWGNHMKGVNIQGLDNPNSLMQDICSNLNKLMKLWLKYDSLQIIWWQS